MSVDLAFDGAVAVITLNRPERKNAFTRAQCDAFAAHLDHIADRSDVHVAIVTGAGGSFSSGQDLREMAELAAQAAADPSASSSSTRTSDPSGTGSGFTVLLDALQRFPKPLLAAVEGVAVGIGEGVAITTRGPVLAASACQFRTSRIWATLVVP